MMTFEQALTALKSGARVSRANWNGKDMWLVLIPADSWSASIDSAFRKFPWIALKTADEGFVPWLASQTDLLSSDWGVVL